MACELLVVEASDHQRVTELSTYHVMMPPYDLIMQADWERLKARLVEEGYLLQSTPNPELWLAVRLSRTLILIVQKPAGNNYWHLSASSGEVAVTEAEAALLLPRFQSEIDEWERRQREDAGYRNCEISNLTQAKKVRAQLLSGKLGDTFVKHSVSCTIEHSKSLTADDRLQLAELKKRVLTH